MVETGAEQCAQFQHLYNLVHASQQLDKTAWLLFSDNDDFFSPFRVEVFRTAITQMLEQNVAGHGKDPFCIPAKLLLPDGLQPDQCKFESYVSMQTLDTAVWNKDPELRRRVRAVTAGNYKDEDADEYFDYCVPTHVLQGFLAVTPAAIRKHQYCDLRFLALLQHLESVNAIDVPGYEWLIAHHKVTIDTKRTQFDAAGGVFYADQRMPGNAADHTSLAPVGNDTTMAQDTTLASTFGMPRAQIEMCRAHVVSIVLQYAAFSTKHLAHYKAKIVSEINEAHGHGLGNELWQQVEQHIEEMFSTEQAKANQALWERQQ